MPLLLVFMAGAGFGGWGLSQADDAIEVATGEKGGIPWLGLAILGAVAFWAYRNFKK